MSYLQWLLDSSLLGINEFKLVLLSDNANNFSFSIKHQIYAYTKM